MKLNTIKYTTCFAMSAVLLMTVGCKKDYTDPSRVPEDNAFKSSAGLTGVAVGVHRAYAISRAGSLYNLVTTDGFLSKQLTILNQGNTAEYQLFQGADKVDPTTNSIV